MEYSDIAFVLRQYSCHYKAENDVRPPIIGHGYTVSMNSVKDSATR